MPILEPGETDREERMNFVDFWAGYVRTHSDEEWSRQQNVLIDGQVERAREVPVDVYLERIDDRDAS